MNCWCTPDKQAKMVKDTTNLGKNKTIRAFDVAFPHRGSGDRTDKKDRPLPRNPRGLGPVSSQVRDVQCDQQCDQQHEALALTM